jgi:hypothetical protein
MSKKDKKTSRHKTARKHSSLDGMIISEPLYEPHTEYTVMSDLSNRYIENNFRQFAVFNLFTQNQIFYKRPKGKHKSYQRGLFNILGQKQINGKNQDALFNGASQIQFNGKDQSSILNIFGQYQKDSKNQFAGINLLRQHQENGRDQFSFLNLLFQYQKNSKDQESGITGLFVYQKNGKHQKAGLTPLTISVNGISQKTNLCPVNVAINTKFQKGNVINIGYNAVFQTAPININFGNAPIWQEGFINYRWHKGLNFFRGFKFFTPSYAEVKSSYIYAKVKATNTPHEEITEKLKNYTPSLRSHFGYYTIEDLENRILKRVDRNNKRYISAHEKDINNI